MIAYDVPVASTNQVETLRIAMAGVAQAHEATRHHRAGSERERTMPVPRTRLWIVTDDPGSEPYD